MVNKYETDFMNLIENEPKYHAFYDENDRANMCKDCVSKLVKKLAKQHRLEYSTALEQFAYDFVSAVETAPIER
jgi:hypothetical protein